MKAEKELGSLQGTEGVSDLFVNLNIELAEACAEFQDRLVNKPIAAFPDKEIAKNNLRNGIPLVAYCPLSFQLEAIRNLAQKTISVFKNYNVITSEFLIWYDSHDESDTLEQIARSCVSFDLEPLSSIANEAHTQVETLFLIGKEIIKPFFRVIAKKFLEMTSLDDWTKGYCPVCGGTPSFARFSKDEEGRRYLWCSRCDIEWNYMRIRCPFCENSEQKTLRFLTTDHREELRIDVCDKCKGYVKTIDERKVEDSVICFAKEEIASVYLDVIAEKEGYLIRLPDSKKMNCTIV